MILDESGTFTQVHLTGYQTDRLMWRRKARRFYWFAFGSFLIGIGIGLMLFK